MESCAESVLQGGRERAKEGAYRARGGLLSGAVLHFSQRLRRRKFLRVFLGLACKTNSKENESNFFVAFCIKICAE